MKDDRRLIEEQIVATYKSGKHFNVAMANAFRAAGGHIDINYRLVDA